MHCMPKLHFTGSTKCFLMEGKQAAFGPATWRNK